MTESTAATTAKDPSAPIATDVVAALQTEAAATDAQESTRALTVACAIIFLVLAAALSALSGVAAPRLHAAWNAAEVEPFARDGVSWVRITADAVAYNDSWITEGSIGLTADDPQVSVVEVTQPQGAMAPKSHGRVRLVLERPACRSGASVTFSLAAHRPWGWVGNRDDESATLEVPCFGDD